MSARRDGSEFRMDFVIVLPFSFRDIF